MLPIQVGVPGVPELLILGILILLFLVPVGLAVLVVAGSVGGDSAGAPERVEALERRVERLEAEIDDRSDRSDGFR